MKIKESALVLNNIPYADKKHIVKLFTKQHGIVNSICFLSNSKNSKTKSAILSPLNFIEADIEFKENKSIHTLLEANCLYVYESLHNNIHKLSIAQFLLEVLNKTLKEESGQPQLFDFMYSNLTELDKSNGNVSGFHHHFLIEFLEFLGFHPENNYSVLNPYFDCREGKFTNTEIPYPLGLNKDISKALASLLNKKETIRLNHSERNAALEGIIAYYKIHVPGFNDLKSIEVLKEVISN